MGVAVQLSVLHSTACEGLSAEAAYALREIVLASTPLDFEFLNPGAFTVYFSASDEGKTQANELARALRQYAHKNEISLFGVATHIGECVASFDSEGHLASRPMGMTVTHAMMAAHKEATGNALS